MTHAAANHRDLDRRAAEAMGEAPGHAVVASRNRMRDVRSLTAPAQARVLLAELVECVSGRGTPYLRGWAGVSNLVAFRGEPDEQGRPTWRLFLTERLPKPAS
jgi:hypothetical protein